MNTIVGITSMILPIVIILEIILFIYLLLDGNGSNSKANIINYIDDSAILIYKLALTYAVTDYKVGTLTLITELLN